MRLLVSFGLCIVLVVTGVALAFSISCKKQNSCAGLVCLNKGSCTDGFCVCAVGVGGDTCQDIFRKSYDNTYGGTANVNSAHITYRLVFSIPPVTTDFVTMALTVETGGGGATNIPLLPIVLSNPTATMGSFNITATTANGATYSGSGTLYAKTASLTLYKTVGSSTDTTWVCANFPVQ
jgi:hypothetical protein